MSDGELIQVAEGPEPEVWEPPLGAFAKLWGEGEHQVLAKTGTDPDGKPEVRVFWRSAEFGGVCSLAFGFDDTDDGWTRADTMLAAMTEARVRGIVRDAEDSLAGEIDE